MDQYAGSSGRSTYCYVELAASFINFLHYCSPSCGFYGAGKDNSGSRTDNLSRCHIIHHPPIFTPNAVFAASLPICPTWDRHQIMLACYAMLPGGLLCRCYYYYYNHLTVSFPGQPKKASKRKVKPVWI